MCACLPGQELTVSYDVACSPDAVEELEFDVTTRCVMTKGLVVGVQP